MKTANPYRAGLSALLFAATLGASAAAQAQGLVGGNPPAQPPARGSGPVIYVTGQDLAYDSIVLSVLPNEGPFQLLEPGGPTGLQTEFGPGDLGFVGGRWWLDDGDGVMEDPGVSGDVYFLCPLLGPGFVPE